MISPALSLIRSSISMNSQPKRLTRETASRRTTTSSRRSKFRDYVSCRRFVLGCLALVVLVVMVIGVVFVAHQYYHDFGGQGFLKSRGPDTELDTDTDVFIYLPLRSVEAWSGRERSWKGQRSPEDIPFYTCGDQQNSCEAFNQPDICCPVSMTCYRRDSSPSGIFCCNSTDSPWQCQAAVHAPAKCIDSTFECGHELGGGK